MDEPEHSGDSSAHMRRALHAADIVGIWDGDLVGGRVYGDDNFARIYGVDPASARAGAPLGSYLKNIHPDDVLAVRSAMDQLYAGADDYASEHRINLPDGRVRWVLTRGRLVRDIGGAAVRFAGVSVDITERKAAEVRQAFLLELADRLRTIDETDAIVGEAADMLGKFLELSRVGFGQIQPDDATILLTTVYARGVAPINGIFPLSNMGLRNVELQRRGATIVLDDVSIYRQQEPDSYRGGGVAALISVPLLRDGRLRATLFASDREVRSWSSEDVRLVESVANRIWDAIERARAEEALRRINASLEVEVANRTRERERNWRLAPVLMIVGDSSGSLVEVNPAWTHTLGWTFEQTIGKSLLDFVAPDDQPVAARGIEHLQQGLALLEFPLTLLTKQSERRRVTWTTVAEGGRFYGYGRDVTEQMLAEERLRQAHKMEAVGQLTGGLAHDFNNLLTGITGSLEVLQSRLREGRTDDADRFIAAARGAARRAGALTHRLLAFSRRQTLAPRATDLNELILGMQDLVERTVGPAHRLELHIEPALWTTLVDPPQLENALLNLAINSRDAMPEGGTIEIRTANEELQGSEARDRDLGAGQYVRLEVRDSGIGMTPAVLARAFDPFFTTKPLGSGTGLGLSMIYGFARQSGGQVQIQSVPNQGTTVAIRLPRHLGAPDPQTEPAAVHEPASRVGADRTVLVVDDEPTVRLLVLEVLGDLGCATIEGESGSEAMAVLESVRPIDLLITDVGLPGKMNGRQLADAARGLRSDLRVLFITGYAEDPSLPRDLPVGMSLLTKPFSLDDLAQAIQALLRDGAHPHRVLDS